ncbi:MAG: cob(I)yrinic acid a,c-diamide adenosyltransferase [Hyphomicrobiales bacterium]|nr:cob(I)yrinic acid a,c-diamide adenosyltransferase [Hyphomicrobiales bacterium]MCY4048085.1 cob(I)yrinic acid a,c-diamide adenosyltransferase [Hyphomicrobiales bacterium]MCY4052652.1 cob(I)yrinic acid a,c-diamide adenosyltransferase [Hyphomicrobiales bacterium]
MVLLNKIYTRGGDGGETALGDGSRRRKDDMRVSAYGSVDETNAFIGVARLSTGEVPGLKDLDEMLGCIQNDLFDLGADLCRPPSKGENGENTPLRISASQVGRLEQEIDMLNEGLEPLRSFVLPGGSAAGTHLHAARTVSRRAEREMVALSRKEDVGAPALHYINRLSDFLFVAARFANGVCGRGDVLWRPGKNR